MYATDLAYVHDDGFGDFARLAAPWLIQRFRGGKITDGPVVDLGCGSGILLRQFEAAGFSPSGIDRSRALANLARKRAPGVPVRVGSVYRTPIPRCRAITAIGEVLSYLPGDGRTRPPYPELFKQVAAALPPGGLFIFDLMERKGCRPMSYRGWRVGSSWTVLIAVTEDIERNVLRREITTFRRAGSSYRRSREVHLLHVADRTEILRLLGRAGFSARIVRAYGQAKLPPRRIGFVAQRLPER